MLKNNILVLKSEIKDDLKSIDKIYKNLIKIIKEINKEPDLKEKSFIGYTLHNLYCAFENIFKNISVFFENQIDSNYQYHINLLKRMKLDIEEIRPRIISDDMFIYLDELKKFRHLFRYSYDYELNYNKMKIVINSASKLKNLYKNEFNKFLKFLNKLKN